MLPATFFLLRSSLTFEVPAAVFIRAAFYAHAQNALTACAQQGSLCYLEKKMAESTSGECWSSPAGRDPSSLLSSPHSSALHLREGQRRHGMRY